MAKDRVERDDEDLVRLYLTDIGQYNLLTKEDEVRLAQAIEQGKQAAEELEIEPDMSVQRKRELRRTVRKGRDAEEPAATRTAPASPASRGNPGQGVAGVDQRAQGAIRGQRAR